MADVRDLIARGKTFGWETLRDAIESAGKVHAGPGMMVRRMGSQSVVSRNRRQIIGGAQPKTTFPIILGVSSSIATATNQWLYHWEEATATDANSGETGWRWAVKVGGRTSADQFTERARNEQEYINTATAAVHGVDIADDSVATITVNAIPQGTVTFVEIVKTATATHYQFSLPNSINVVCNA
jgi:hypothetical protein